MKNFGGITSKHVRGISPMVCLSAMLGISPMVCIWGVPHAPVSVLLRSGEQNPLTLPLFGRMPEPQSERRKLFGSPQAPYLRWRVFGRMPKPRGVYGEYPMPPRQDAAAIRGLGVPKPHISDGVYLGVAQAPRCIWGVPHAPKTGRCRYSGSRTQSRRRKLFGSPQAPYLRWCVFGRMPKPRGVYGEYPMPPRQDAAAIRGNARGFMGSTPCPQDKTLPLFGEPNPIFHFSLFIFHF